MRVPGTAPRVPQYPLARVHSTSRVPSEAGSKWSQRSTHAGSNGVVVRSSRCRVP